MRNWGVLILAAILMGASGCGKKGSIEANERTRAPAGAHDVGLLVEYASRGEIETLLGEYPEAQVRILNQAHGMYEIFGVPREEVARFVTVPAMENHYFLRAQSDFSEQGPLAKAFSVAGPEGITLPGMNKCKRGESGPRAVLSVTAPTRLHGETIELGTSIQANSRSSTAALSPEQLKSAMVILPPWGSKNGEVALAVADLDYTPDTMGVYQIITVVQDANDNCAMDAVAFLVTSNKPYAGPGVPEVAVEMTNFSHLDMISATESWAIAQGDGVTIAIIDSGVNYNHPTLARNILVNEAEIDGNGIDDDGNGLVDDVVGYDFVNRDPYPYDDAGHGTHVAGLAASFQYGMAPKAKILSLKAMSAIGGDIGTVSAAIRYAADRGARVINLSLGAPSPLPHPTLVSAANYAESKGALLVVAAGNGDEMTGLGFSIDDIPVFPAALKNDNVLTVASFDRLNALSPYSNFGPISVDIAAPGGLTPWDPMISAIHENASNQLYMGMTGTSMAAPVAAGIAAQILGLRPSLSASEVREIMIGAGREMPALKSVIVSGRWLNALDAVKAVSN